MIGRFDSLNSDITKIITKIFDSPDLCKFIYYDNPDPLSQPDFDTYELMYSNLYPYSYNIDENTEANNYLTVEFSDFKLLNNCFKAGKILINIIIPKSNMRTDYGLRYYCIANYIDSLYNDQFLSGVGKIKFDSMGRLFVDKNYSGIYLLYDITQFN